MQILWTNFFSTLPLFRPLLTLRPENAQYAIDYNNYNIYFILLPHVFACDMTVI